MRLPRRGVRAGLRSATGNRVPGESWVAGSNPALSASTFSLPMARVRTTRRARPSPPRARPARTHAARPGSPTRTRRCGAGVKSASHVPQRTRAFPPSSAAKRRTRLVFPTPASPATSASVPCEPARASASASDRAASWSERSRSIADCLYARLGRAKRANRPRWRRRRRPRSGSPLRRAGLRRPACLRHPARPAPRPHPGRSSSR